MGLVQILAHPAQSSISPFLRRATGVLVPKCLIWDKSLKEARMLQTTFFVIF